jgi:hypothetical protein
MPLGERHGDQRAVLTTAAVITEASRTSGQGRLIR